MRKRILVILLLVSLIGAGWIEARRGSQYKPGMSLPQVRALSGNKYPLKQFAMGLEGITQQEMLEEQVYYMYDDDSGVILYFNYYQVLIRKERIKYFGVNVPELVDSFRCSFR